MKLIHLGKEIDSSVEYELFSDNENGFNVTVTYKKDSWMSQKKGQQVTRVFNNCTEIHHLFEEDRIAFGSDIHLTGCTRSVDDIESVVIEISNRRETSFY